LVELVVPSVAGASRALILGAAHNPVVERVVARYGMRLGASRFVAGETLDECVAVLRTLNRAGFKANTTILGENVRDPAVAEQVADRYEEVLRRIRVEGLRVNVSLKLTHLGLLVDGEACYGHLRRLLGVARETGSFVRMDMEESALVDRTLAIYERARAEGFDEIGLVLQAYLRRTPADLDRLLPLRPNLRLVKGAYLEPAEVAYPAKADVDRAYLALAERALQSAGYTALATHDDRIIERLIAFAEQHGIDRNRFEFQMLYGVRPQLQRQLLERGYTVLVATPFGEAWYPYLMRRLAERPANVLFLLRNLLRG
jgi:proline dehydrogenase